MTNGMLLVNKPEGVSSARVVDQVKKIFQVKKAGHTGTLDPFATGLLPVALGRATRISRFFLGSAKRYRAVVTLGVETDTYDRTGNIVHQADSGLLESIQPEQIRNVIAGFFGKQQQVAPSFSALKHQGQPLYKLARQGKMIQKPARAIEIYAITLTAISLPEFEMDVQCSGGTYIRSLAHDMGRILGCGAHLSGLCRTGVSQFTLDQAHDLDMVQASARQKIFSYVIPMADCLSFMPLIQADARLEEKIRYGRKLSVQDILSFRMDQISKKNPVRITGTDGRLIAVIEADKTGAGYNYCCVFSA
ncbi:MAG: tRNA pseudouridine(55) synthase TruB [Desulfotignum sp.]|nr:tRNA pseudouridine(55) synthase TruB [Desulfotignum sp.]MCF8125106.1 tRNA pseudouridine(55) synthase TruB [Desulfotignum sp.]